MPLHCNRVQLTSFPGALKRKSTAAARESWS